MKKLGLFFAFIYSMPVYASGPEIDLGCLSEKLAIKQGAEQSAILFLINGSDCINCYAAVNYALGVTQKEHKKVWFSFFNLPKAEQEYFITNTLNFNIEKENIIPFDALKSCISDVLLSTVVFIDKANKANSFHNSFKSLSKEELTKLRAAEIQKTSMVQPVDSFDVTEWAGSNNPDIVPYTENTLLLFNEMRGAVYGYDKKSRTVLWTIDKGYFEPLRDSILMLNNKEITPGVMDLNKSDPEKELAYFKSKISFRTPDVYDGNIYIPFSILSYGIDPYPENPQLDTFITWYSFLAKFSPERKCTHIWAFPTIIEEVPQSYNNFPNWGMVNANELYMQVSTRRADDSLFVLQTFSDKRIFPEFKELIHVGYPKILPRVDEQGITMRYWANRVKINNAHYYYYFSSVQLLNENGVEKIELSNTASLSDTSQKFKLSLIVQHPLSKHIYVSGIDNSNAGLKVYDAGFKYLTEYSFYPSKLYIINNDKEVLLGLHKTEEKTILYTYLLP